jgi:dephospho-CoA kinase
MKIEKTLIIGTAGMPGSGKATLKILAENKGYPVVVMGDEIREETKRRGLEPTPENIGKIMLEIREEDGPTAVVKRCLPKIQNTDSNMVLVDGIRSIQEMDEFKKRYESFVLIAVHSSPEARFQRLSKRKRSDDPKGWDVFRERDMRELAVGQGNVIALADYMIVNEATYDEFKVKCREVLEEIVKKWTR